MLINYIKLSIRLMARNPFFTFIKVSGLASRFGDVLYSVAVHAE